VTTRRAAGHHATTRRGERADAERGTGPAVAGCRARARARHPGGYAIAGGRDELAAALQVATLTELRAMLRTEAPRRADVLLAEAGGDRGRAYDALVAERRRWTAD
jgi:hypothetical protein